MSGRAEAIMSELFCLVMFVYQVYKRLAATESFNGKRRLAPPLKELERSGQQNFFFTVYSLLTSRPPQGENAR
jgi:hypothetical protein